MTATERSRVLRDTATWLHLSPARVEQLWAGELAIVGLEADGLAMLTRVPRAGWGTDRLMRARILSTLVEEFPVSLGTAGLTLAGEFVDHDAFWPVLHERQPLATGFSTFARGTVGDVAVIEGEISSARRGFLDVPAVAGGDAAVRLGPGVAAVTVENGAFAAWTAAWSKGHGLPHRVAAGERLAAATWSGESTALLIQVVGSPPAAHVSESTAEFVQLFTWLQDGKSEERVVAYLGEFGASPTEAYELLAEWRADGLITG